jgi:hypothetical protein
MSTKVLQLRLIMLRKFRPQAIVMAAAMVIWTKNNAHGPRCRFYQLKLKRLLRMLLTN